MPTCLSSGVSVERRLADTGVRDLDGGHRRKSGAEAAVGFQSGY
jgi:hypothetical protein